MSTNSYIDETTGYYTKLHTERAMSFKDFLDCIDRLRSQCDVINWQIDAMSTDYTLACVYMR